MANGTGEFQEYQKECFGGLPRIRAGVSAQSAALVLALILLVPLVVGSDGSGSWTGSSHLSAAGPIAVEIGETMEPLEGLTGDSASTHPVDTRKRLALGMRIDINHAGSEELTAVPGLTRRRADRIIQYRATCGPIRQIEQLATEHVLGAETVRRIRPFVTCVL